ncbi:MAG TPA: hypothetical protein VMS63_01440 [Gaiellaceae bacterium]|nr:hypothetical protein [Gaiellaceae bacterium]
MKRILTLFMFVLALAFVGAASAGPRIGFAEDATKYADDGGQRLFAEMDKLGATTNRVAVFWNADAPTTIQDQSFLDRMLPIAERHNTQIVFAVYPLKATMAPTTPTAVNEFCSYAVAVMQRYPYVRKVIIGNEPNQPHFWQPIWNADGSPASPAAMEAVLAGCYDKLKAFDPTLDVIGVGLSPRGNDNPHASSNSSISPVRWIAALGKAYRASGRTSPLFDEWSWHCYPNVNTDEVETGYAWPNTGCVNAARVKLALWDAFHGTGQPVTDGYLGLDSVGSTLFGSLKTFIDETGWQVDTTGLPGYSNTENVPTISEAKQAQDYEKLVRLADCEPTLTDFHIFHEIDEADRTGFQSGVLHVDFSERPAAVDVANSVQHGIAADNGSCSGGVWKTLGTTVLSPTAVVPLFKTFPYKNPLPFAAVAMNGGAKYVKLRAGEGFTYVVTFKDGGKTSKPVTGAAPRTVGSVKVPAGFGKGTVTIVLTAEMDPARTSTVTLLLGGSK